MLKVKLSLKKIIFIINLYFSLIYILMRPVLQEYVSGAVKYIFIVIVIETSLIAVCSSKIIKRIGTAELLLLLLFYLYVLMNAIFFGGTELLYYAIERYVFLTLPLFILPLIHNKINWDNVLKFIVIFGVVDAVCSIYEFATHDMLFPKANINTKVLMQMSSYKIIRTYGLNGEYFTLAEILCMCGLASFFLWKFKKVKWAIYSFIIITVGILTTGSRGYYVAYLMGFFILYISDSKGMHLNKIQILKIGLILLIFVIFLWILLGTRFTTNIQSVDVIITRMRQIFIWNGEDANESRVQAWKKAINAWKQSPIFGLGACSTDTRYSKIQHVTESGVLKRLEELGIIGTVLQYLTMFIPLSKGIVLFRKSINKDQTTIFFFAIIIAYFTEDLVLQRYTELEYTIILWISISFIAYCQKPLKRNDS